MNSERHTDNYINEARRRARQRHKRILLIRSIILILIISVVLLLCFLFVYTKMKNRITDWYEFSDKKEYDLAEEYTDRLDLFAKDYVVCQAINTDDPEFTAPVGFSAKLDEPYAKFSKGVFERIHPASTTKIMTALLAIKYGKLDEQVVVPPEAEITEVGTSLADIKPGQTLTLEQLLYGLMLPSGNDCANAIAVHIGGSIDGFAAMMNEEARSIGANATHYSNPNGLTDEDHYTTAYDLYLILHEAMKYEKFRQIASTKLFTAEFIGSDGLATCKYWTTTNKYLLGERSLPEGYKLVSAKTGTTLAAGNCLVLATENNQGDRFVSIVLAAENKQVLYDNMDYLLLNFTE